MRLRLANCGMVKLYLRYKLPGVPVYKELPMVLIYSYDMGTDVIATGTEINFIQEK
jgi:hypothetical protein